MFPIAASSGSRSSSDEERRANRYGAVILPMCDCPFHDLKLAGWRRGMRLVRFIIGRFQRSRNSLTAAPLMGLFVSRPVCGRHMVALDVCSRLGDRGWMNELLVGYARASTEQQDLTAQRNGLHALGVGDDRIYVDHGLTGSNRDRPGLRLALAACRAGDTLVVTKLDRLARLLPDARDILDELTRRKVKLSPRRINP
jgi:Resolvase, N terminal domain